MIGCAGAKYPPLVEMGIIRCEEGGTCDCGSCKEPGTVVDVEASGMVGGSICNCSKALDRSGGGGCVDFFFALLGRRNPLKERTDVKKKLGGNGFGPLVSNPSEQKCLSHHLVKALFGVEC